MYAQLYEKHCMVTGKRAIYSMGLSRIHTATSKQRVDYVYANGFVVVGLIFAFENFGSHVE